jgi:hypothetical protein
VLATSRSYALAAAAIAAVSTVVAMPIVARQAPLSAGTTATPRAVSADVNLVDSGESLLNIPLNLLDDIVNIPYNETIGGGLGTVADSFLFTGTWWVPSSTNLWGIDPGDPTHIALIDNFLPFEAFTQGFTNADGVYEPGLNYELAGLLAAELPVSASCDANTCFPMTPPEVITGSTQFDRDIGFFEALTGNATDGDGNKFSLFSDFYKVGIGQLIHGYTFDATDPGGAVNPENGATTGLGLLGYGLTGNPFEGGTGPDGAEPWNGLDFHLNLLAPVQTLIDSWEQPVTGGIGGTGIEIPTIEGIAHTFENLYAGFIIDFDPFTEGSPACPALCDIPESMKIPALVADIAKMDPSNTTLSQWVADYKIDPTLVNEPTQDQINSSVALLQTGMYNLTPTELTHVDFLLGQINPELPALMTNMGWYTDPDYLALSTQGATTYIDPVTGATEQVLDSTGNLNPDYGGYNLSLVGGDLVKLFEHPLDFGALTSQDWAFLADPVSTPDPLNGGTVDGGTNTFGEWLTKLFDGGVSTAPDPVGNSAAAVAESGGFLANLHADLATDWAALLASMGGSAVGDAGGGMFADMAGQLSADLATVFPNLF